jgi:uncharacterized membrane protein YsdA (DUF1294 family)
VETAKSTATVQDVSLGCQKNSTGKTFEDICKNPNAGVREYNVACQIAAGSQNASRVALSIAEAKFSQVLAEIRNTLQALRFTHVVPVVEAANQAGIAAAKSSCAPLYRESCTYAAYEQAATAYAEAHLPAAIGTMNQIAMAKAQAIVNCQSTTLAAADRAPAQNDRGGGPPGHLLILSLFGAVPFAFGSIQFAHRRRYISKKVQQILMILLTTVTLMTGCSEGCGCDDGEDPEVSVPPPAGPIGGDDTARSAAAADLGADGIRGMNAANAALRAAQSGSQPTGQRPTLSSATGSGGGTIAGLDGPQGGAKEIPGIKAGQAAASGGGGGGAGGGGAPLGPTNSPGMSTSPASAPLAQTEALQLTGEVAGTRYGGGGGGGAAGGGGSPNFGSLFGGGGNDAAGRGPATVAFGSQSGQAAVATMGTPDPLDYFARSRKEDLIFHMITRRATAVSIGWNIEDSRHKFGR